MTSKNYIFAHSHIIKKGREHFNFEIATSKISYKKIHEDFSVFINLFIYLLQAIFLLSVWFNEMCLRYLQIQPELERLGDCHFLGSLHRSKGNLPPPAALTPGSPGQHSVGNPCPPLSVCTHSPSGIFPARHVSTCKVHVCVESSLSVLAQLITSFSEFSNILIY